MANASLWSMFIIACALAGVGCGSASPDAQTATETIPLDLSGERPTAQLTIGANPPVTAIFDTGAAASVLKLAFAQELKLQNLGSANAHGPGGAPIEGFRTTLQGQLGSAHFGPTLAVALDIPLPLPGVDAVISPSVFAGRLVRIDFAHGVAIITLRSPANIPEGPAHPNVGGNTFMSVTSVPAVGVVLPDGRIIQADVDTGTENGLNLPLAMASGIALTAPMERAGAQHMVGVTRATFTAHIRGDIHVGALMLHDPAVTFVDGAERPVVGMAILRQSVIVIDPAEHRSWLIAPAASG